MLFITSLLGVGSFRGLTPKTQGFSLFEVLIATFILSFGLLGMVEIYLYSFKRVEESFRQTLEVSELISMKEGSASLFSGSQPSSSHTGLGVFSTGGFIGGQKKYYKSQGYEKHQ